MNLIKKEYNFTLCFFFLDFCGIYGLDVGLPTSMAYFRGCIMGACLCNYAGFILWHRGWPTSRMAYFLLAPWSNSLLVYVPLTAINISSYLHAIDIMGGDETYG
jgi:hypothetical protein